ncbi:MAG: class I SAM-dependent methyltransferase [Acidobacteriota bacterium]
MSADEQRAKDAEVPEGTQAPSLDLFLGEPTRRLSDWHWLFAQDAAFPIRSDRGLLGRVLVAFKRLLRPLVKTPQNDLWERQRVFNLILLEHLQALESDVRSRLEHLEAFRREGLDEVMRHGDALYSRVDQKLDRQSRQSRELTAQLRSALARSEVAVGALREGLEAADYVAFEHRHRGTEEDIRRRVEVHLPRLEGQSPVLDLGCGRGEALAALVEGGVDALGVDSNAEMVRQCLDKGLSAKEGDLLEVLAASAPASLGGVVSFHVIEHLPWDVLRRMLELSFAALRPGGRLLLETPNPSSLRVGAREFWRDPTHVRPVHPDALEALCQAIGFVDVEIVPLNRFPEATALPDVEVPRGASSDLALAIDGVQRLRDRLDDLLHGDQDYALVATRPNV